MTVNYQKESALFDVGSIEPSLNLCPAGSSIQQSETLIPSEPFALNNSIMTCNQLWEEFSQGINGKVSIKYLDETFGSNWRKKDPIKKHYSRRLVFAHAHYI